MTEIVLENPGPKQLAESIRSECKDHDDRWERLSPFRAAGWPSNRRAASVWKLLACKTIDVDYKNGQFELQLWTGKKALFSSAKGALAYVDEIEKYQDQ